ncbi:hypothetical protein [Streptomyces sp. MAR4 CNX-425]|uniref:hypothetical protein n=1 Tax=Streptomyces sp. MAR4 CNX-425 TaxID=3406343 RepID=UPI003B5086A7
MRRTGPGGRLRLAVPGAGAAALGCDAVGVPERLGYDVTARLPRVGCVFAYGGRWWWIVPGGSDLGLFWPPAVDYAPGAAVSLAAAGPGGAAAVPRLVHRPADGVPYTPPIPLYLLLCRRTGTEPAWSCDVAGAAGGRSDAA